MSYKLINIKRGMTEIENIYKDITTHGGIICGGYARYVCSPKKNPYKASDMDIYCKNIDIFDNLRILFEHKTCKYMFEVKHENDMSVTYNKSDNPDYMYLPVIQLIKPIREGAIVTCGTIEDILDNFDFTVTRVAINDNKTCLVDKDFEEHEIKNLLVLRKIHCPVSSLLRCLKYTRKGYYMKPFEAMKLFSDWDVRSDEYRDRLAELFSQSKVGNMSQEEIDELESLLRID